MAEPDLAQDVLKDTADLELLDHIRVAIASGDGDLARQCADQMLDHDALALLEDLTPPELSVLFAVLGDESLATLLARLDDRDAARILTRMSVDQAADILEEISPDDATDIFAEVESTDPDLAGTIMFAMDADEAAEIRELMAYPPDSAGGIMTPAFVAVYPDLRADETIVALRKVAEEAEIINYVYVIDRDETLIGVLSLHSLVLSHPDTVVRELLSPSLYSVTADTDQEVAARLLVERGLLALPVVDNEGHLIGIITADDVADVLEEEATEDIERLGGSQPLEVPYLRASPIHLFRKRIVWLLVLFFASFMTVSIQQHFDSTLARYTILAAFVPILIGTGGNVGSQTVTTIIRAMALDEIRPGHILRIIGKEALTGLALGIVMGALMFLRAMIASDGTETIALVVGMTVLALTTWAATVGAILPIVLSKLKVDPAVVSAPFISSLVDSTGLVIYFLLAGRILEF